VNVIAPSSVTRRARAPAVIGTMTPKAALERLVSNSDLRIQTQPDGSFILSSTAARDDATSPAPPEGSFQVAQQQGGAAPRTAPPATDSDEGDATLPGIDVIVVTATKRGQVALQDVALSVTAFDEDRLDRLNVQDFDQFIVQVPSTNFLDNGGPGRGNEIASIRGLSPVADNTGPVVAQYLDGAPRFGRNYRLFDIGEVSVLRGPQGTLWGAQALGGLISFTSNRPNFDGLQAQFESDFYTTESADASYRAAGVVNVPIVDDTFAVRVAAQHIDESGYVDNVLTGADNVNDIEETAWRLSALYRPLDNLALTVIYHGNDLSTDAPSFYNPAAGDLNSTTPIANEPGSQRFDLVNLIVEASFAWADFTYNGSYFNLQNEFTEFPRNVLGTAVVRDETDVFEDSWTHEFRLNSTTDGPLQWIVGVFTDELDSGNTVRQTEIRDPNDPAWTPTFAENFPVTVIGGPESFDETAVFGEVSYNLTERLNVLLGGRYFDWEVGNDQELTFFGTDFNQTTGKVGNDDFFYKLQAAYDVSDDVLLYGARSEGFRFGGFNPFVGLPGITEEFKRFDPDTLTNYELGWKTAWLDRRLIVNGAVYFSEWEDIQLVVLPPGDSPFAFSTNAGNLDAWGGELEFATEDLLFEGFYLAGSFAYSRNEFTEDADPFNRGFAFIEDGDELRRTPRNTWSLDAGYEFRLSRFDAFVRANYWHKDSTTTEGFNGNDGIIPIPAQNVVNASAGLSGESWRARIYIDNLTDTRPFQQVVPRFDDLTAIDTVSTIRPRTVGIDVRFSFGDSGN
ncbi:MAG: TonB-dependent receptor, partial [Pseudomonadota bacterium]